MIKSNYNLHIYSRNIHTIFHKFKLRRVEPSSDHTKDYYIPSIHIKQSCSQSNLINKIKKMITNLDYYQWLYLASSKYVWNCFGEETKNTSYNVHSLHTLLTYPNQSNKWTGLTLCSNYRLNAKKCSHSFTVVCFLRYSLSLCLNMLKMNSLEHVLLSHLVLFRTFHIVSL